MRVNRNSAGLAIAIAAGVVLLVSRSGLERLRARDTAPSETTVDDRTGVLDSGERARIADYHAALRRTHDIDYRVLALI
jgi:uncharacterized membrane protein YgcG